MSRVLVIGASGLLGNALFHRFDKYHTAIGTQFSQQGNFETLDIRDIVPVRTLTRKFLPDIILLPAANPHVDYCQQYPSETWGINVEGSKNVLKVAKEVGATFVFYSTDYVFDGKNGPYNEDDIPNPLQEYGRQKYHIEKLLPQTTLNYLILRVSGLYGYEQKKKNFVYQVLQKIAAKESMMLWTDQYYNPTDIYSVAECTEALLEGGRRGIYHIAGAEHLNRFTFAGKIADVFSLDHSLLHQTSLNSAAVPRPPNSGLLTSKLCRDTNVRLRSTAEGLAIMKRWMGD